MKGERIRIGLTIPKGCTNFNAAVAWVHVLLSSRGARLIEKVGKLPVKPVFGGGISTIPAELTEFADESRAEKEQQSSA